MSELSPKARALLARTAAGFEPRSADRDRVRSDLYARIGAAAAAGGATALAGRSTRLGFGPLVGKGIAAAVVLSAAVLTFTLTRPQTPSARLAAPTPTQVAPPPPPAAEESIPVVEVASLPSVQPKATRTAPSAGTRFEPDSLEREMSLLRDAQAATREHDDARALALLDAHARQYPRGVLAEERAAARIFALCNLGRTNEGLATRAAFLAAHPSSPHTSRVRAACGGE